MDEHHWVAAARDREARGPAVDLDGLSFQRFTTSVAYESRGTADVRSAT
jgi:hypothetical protein